MYSLCLRTGVISFYDFLTGKRIYGFSTMCIKFMATTFFIGSALGFSVMMARSFSDLLLPTPAAELLLDMSLKSSLRDVLALGSFSKLWRVLKETALSLHRMFWFLVFLRDLPVRGADEGGSDGASGSVQILRAYASREQDSCYALYFSFRALRAFCYW